MYIDNITSVGPVCKDYCLTFSPINTRSNTYRQRSTECQLSHRSICTET